MNILFRGGGFGNKGAEAMLKTAKHELAQRLPSAKFRAAVAPYHARAAHEAGLAPSVAQTPLEFWLLNLRRVPGPISRCSSLACRLQSRRHIRMLEDCGALFDVSGYAYHGTHRSYSTQLTDKVVSECHRKNLPVIFLPQAWGPFIDLSAQNRIRHIAEKATLLYARDKTSYEHLRRIPGFPFEKVALAPDIALRFEPEETPNTIGPIAHAGLREKDRPRVGISPSMVVYRATEQKGRGDANPYVRWLAVLGTRLLKETDVELVLFPHELSPSMWRQDDRTVCRLVGRSLPTSSRARYFMNDSSADTLKLLIRSCDFLVSSRFHSIIAALSYHIPTVAIGWSHKYDELLNDVGIPDAALSHDTIDTGAALRRVLEAWRNRSAMQRCLQRNVPALKHRAGLEFDRISAILKESGE